MRRTRTRGKTLLEAVVIISIMALIVGLSATSLATLFLLRNQMTRDSEQATALTRLGTRLRLDIHEASAAALDAGCLLTLPHGLTIHYTFAAPRVVRAVKRYAAVVHLYRFVL